jgi:hypothetical protein
VVGNQIWQIAWRIVASVIVLAVALFLLEELASLVGVINVMNATSGSAILTYVLGGVVLLAALFSVGWVWAPWLRPQAQAAELR